MSQSLTTMPTTRMRLRQRLLRLPIIRTKPSGVYSSTKILLTEFAEALSHADKVVLADIYAARETDTLGISSLDLKHEIEKLGKECFYFGSFEEIEKFLSKNCINGDLLITMGAGNVYQIGEALISQ